MIALQLLMTVVILVEECSATCYFPAVFQGTYVTQVLSPNGFTPTSMASPVWHAQSKSGFRDEDGPWSPNRFVRSSERQKQPVSYNTMKILSDSIPVWGKCHKKFGSNVILVERTPSTHDSRMVSNETVGHGWPRRKARRIRLASATYHKDGIKCYKCFSLHLRSVNVVQFHTNSLQMCHSTETEAMQDCPTDEAVKMRRVREITLFKTKSNEGASAMTPVFCPISGVAYNFDHISRPDQSGRSVQCVSGKSTVADCPYGFALAFKFRDCSTDDRDMTMQCLGDWDSGLGDGSRFLAMMDTAAGGWRPQYRCAMYREDPITGHIRFAMSADSTCTSQLRSPTSGSDVFHLRPDVQSVPLPSAISTDTRQMTCEIPTWAQGHWETMTVIGQSIIIQEYSSQFKRFHLQCLERHNLDGRIDSARLVMEVSSHCQTPSSGLGSIFTAAKPRQVCLWLKHRGPNTMEYQLSLSEIQSSDSDDNSVCHSGYFQDRSWSTIGRLGRIESSGGQIELGNSDLHITEGDPDAAYDELVPYPIVGEYTGVIPDSDGSMCTRMYSDCNNPHIMFYSIFNCYNKSEVIEDREYRCLGAWTEKGLIYTYTERRDMIPIQGKSHECFVGMINASTGDIYLLEAGLNCQHGSQEPMTHGMRLSQISRCYVPPHRQRLISSATDKRLTTVQESRKTPHSESRSLFVQSLRAFKPRNWLEGVVVEHELSRVDPDQQSGWQIRYLPFHANSSSRPANPSQASTLGSIICCLSISLYLTFR